MAPSKDIINDANLLKMANDLITQSLNKNLFNNKFLYVNHIKTPERPGVQIEQIDYLRQSNRAAVYYPNPPPPTPGLQNDISAKTSKENLYNDGPPSLIKGGPYSGPGFVGPLRNFDIFAIAHWARNVGSEILGLPKWQNDPVSKTGKFESAKPGVIQKTATWVASNFLLASLNRGDPQAYGPGNLVWNPLSLPSALLPARGVSPTERATVGNIATTYSDNVKASAATNTERLLLIRKGLYSEVAPIERLQKLKSPVAPPGFIGTTNGPLQGLGDIPSNLSTIEVVTNGTFDQAAAALSYHTNLYNQERPYGVDTAAMPLEKLEAKFTKLQKSGLFSDDELSKIKTDAIFSPKPFPGAGGLSSGRDMTFIAKPFAQFIANRGISAKDLPVVNAGFDAKDELNGTISDNSTGPASDDENYLPFFFQDLRDSSDTFLYFRAFLKDGFSETLTPEWQEDHYYGRVDPIPVYMATLRTINLSFDVVAWSPKDLPVIMMKLQKLQSMTYPLYDKQGFLQAGPIIRMRVGDLIAASKGKGLPGYLTALDFSYDETIWNIKKDFKVPMKITVSLGFTVVHEANPGLYLDEGTKQIKFGTGEVTGEGKNIKVSKISQADFRKIFGQVRNES